MAFIPLVFVLIATVFDVKTREVPDAIPLGLFGWSVLATGCGFNGVGWGSLVAGFVLGLFLSGVVFAVGGTGGGDVKLLAALGAALGHAALLPVLFWTALAGGILALIAIRRGRRDLAYLPAIALGLTVYLFWHERIVHATHS